MYEKTSVTKHVIYGSKIWSVLKVWSTATTVAEITHFKSLGHSRTSVVGYVHISSGQRCQNLGLLFWPCSGTWTETISEVPGVYFIPCIFAPVKKCAGPTIPCVSNVPSGVSRISQRGCANYVDLLLWPFSPKNCVKILKNWVAGGTCVPSVATGSYLSLQTVSYP